MTYPAGQKISKKITELCKAGKGANMGIIKILDTLTANQIAAGEVVERPYSVVKELCENSLDAGAGSIYVNIKNGGISLINVTDNGCGMDSIDLKSSFLRHATSKINSVYDFDNISTMGFRGEALASIASVSRIKIKSKRSQDETGYFLELEAGKIISEGPAACSDGTSIIVESLFFNTPARYKFLKKDFTEASYIADIIERMVLARPDVSFYLNNNGKEILHSPGNNDLKSAIFSVYGKNITDSLIPVSYEGKDAAIYGFAGSPSISRKNRQHQSVFINNRYVKSNIVTAACEEAYKTVLMKGKYPFFVLKINVNPATIDVNVHPQKTQIKFNNESEIFRAVFHAVKNAVLSDTGGTIPFNNNYKKEEENQLTNINNPDNSNKSEDKNIINGNNGNNESNNKDFVVNKSSNQEQDEKTLQLKENKPSFDFTRSGEQVEIDQTPEKESLNIETNKEHSFFIKTFSEMKYIGTLFNLYLIFEYNNEMVIIDQHAAHERILFEKLLQMQKNKKIISQNLLSPQIVELTSNETMILNENLELFESLGFDCEIFGTKSVIIRSVPLGGKEIDPEKAFKSVIDDLSKFKGQREDFIDEALYTIACKAAVKANDKLSRPEIEGLVEDMKNTIRSSRCPHGRPSFVKIGKKDIEKWFKRIVD